MTAALAVFLDSVRLRSWVQGCLDCTPTVKAVVLSVKASTTALQFQSDCFRFVVDSKVSSNYGPCRIALVMCEHAYLGTFK